MKPGPKLKKNGKKKTYTFTLSVKAREILNKLSGSFGTSASEFLETTLLCWDSSITQACYKRRLQVFIENYRE